MKILHGHSEALAQIASKAIPDMSSGFGPCQALGVVTGYTASDKLEAVCIYHEYQPTHKTIMMSFVAFSPRWAQRGIIRALLSVSFRQYGVKKVWCSTSIKNTRCQKFLKGLGFKKEATLAHHLGENNHALIYRMMEQDFVNKYEKVLQKKQKNDTQQMRGDVTGLVGISQPNEGMPWEKVHHQLQPHQIQ